MRAAWSLVPRQQESEGHSSTIQLLCRKDNAESGSEKLEMRLETVSYFMIFVIYGLVLNRTKE